MNRSHVRLPLFLFLLFLCIGSSHYSREPESKNPMQIVMDQIDSSGSRIGKTYDMFHMGYKMEGKFLHLELCFFVHRKLAKAEARELLLLCAEEFMNDINANEELRPHLSEYPFTLNNVGINFYFQEEDGTGFHHPDLSYAAWRPRGIQFATKDPEKKGGFKLFDTETHEEALALIKVNQ